MALLRALAVLGTLVLLAVVLAKAGQSPVPVNLQWGQTTFGTTAPVAVTLLLLVMVLAFFAGQAGSWLMRIPSMLQNFVQGHHRQSTVQQLADAFTHLAMGNTAAAAKLAKKLKAEGPEQPLITLLHTQLGQLSGAEETKALQHPTLGQLAALQAARRAAKSANWEGVRELTAKYTHNIHPAFTVLHFKALVNLNDPRLTTFLPELKPLLSKSHYQLVSTITATGITTPHAAVLSQPWVKQFQKWLTTPDETFPSEPPNESKAA